MGQIPRSTERILVELDMFLICIWWLWIYNLNTPFWLL